MCSVGLNQQMPTKLFERIFAHISRLGRTESGLLANRGAYSLAASAGSRNGEGSGWASIIWFNSGKFFTSLNFASVFFCCGNTFFNRKGASCSGMVCADTDRLIVLTKAMTVRKCFFLFMSD